jgi:hypothetical protein
MKKFLAVLLCICMMASLCVIGVGAETQSSTPSGTLGTEQNPYTINNLQELKDFAADVNSGKTYSGEFVKLTANIDLSGAEFTPIGVAHFPNSKHDTTNDPDRPFCGTFDGNGYTISNFKVSQTDAEKAANANATHTKAPGTNDYDHNLDVDNHSKGLFGYVEGGTIENLTVSRATITGGNAEAAVVGTLENGTVSQVDVYNSNVSGAYENAGAVVGRAYGDTSVTGCYVSDCNINLPTDNPYENGAGGLIGRTQGGTQSINGNIVTDTTVQAYRKAAGLIGYILQPESVTISNDAVSADVKINAAAANSNNGNKPYYGLLYAEVQGSGVRCYETYDNDVYGRAWNGTAPSPDPITIGTTTSVFKAPKAATSGNITTLSARMSQVAVVINDIYGGSMIAKDIASAIKYFSENDSEHGNNKVIVLINDVNEDVTVPAGVTVDIDLRGHTLKNVAGDTITNNGTLLIQDLSSEKTGVVENLTPGKTVIQNNVGATADLYSGTVHKGSTGSNDYYAITNHGTFDINGGKIASDCTHASAIENGWYTPSQNTTAVNSVMNITNGEVVASGGLYTVKNDDYGVMTISGGTFTNTAAEQGTVLNWNKLTISGGTFNAANSSVGTMAESASENPATPKNSYEQGNTTITGGYFKGYLGSNDSYKAAITVSVSGGYFTSDPTAYVVAGKAAKTTTETGYSFTVGDAEKENATPAVAAPEVKVPDQTKLGGVTVKEAKAVAASTTVKDNTLTDAAAAKAANNTVSADVGAADLTAAGIDAEAKGTKIVVQTYLDLNITGASTSGETKTISVDITPMYRTVATLTSTDNNNIKTAGTEQNAVVVGQPQPLKITTPTVISMNLPTGFVTITAPATTATVYVQHKGAEYVGTVRKSDSGALILTFTTYGFSPFTISATSAAVAKVGNDSYTTLQAAIDAAASGDTINLTGSPADTNVNISGKSLTIICGTNTFDANKIALGANTTKTVTGTSGTNQVIAITYTAPIGGGSTSAKTYTVTVDKADNGTVTASAASAEAGKTVTLTVAPAAGYTLDTLTVKDASGAAVTVAKSGDNACTFTMPASNVTVTAAFKKAAAPEWKNPFTDVADNAWYYEAVKTASQANIIKGTSDTTFSPDQMITRQEMWMILCRMYGQTPASMAEARTLAMAAKITDGTNPTGTITREQFATMLFRYAKLMGLDTTQGGMAVKEFSDYGKISGFALEAMTWAVNAGLMNGYNNKLMPGAGTSRGQAVVILVRAYSSIIK